MAIERNNIEERQARLDLIMAERRATQKRLLVKQGLALLKRTEMARQAVVRAKTPRTTLH